MAPIDDPSSWVTSFGAHGGTAFQIDHPVGWSLQTLPTTAIVSCLEEANALVSLMWMHGTGCPDPVGLLAETLRYNGISDYETIRASPIRSMPTQSGPFRQIVQEALFTYRGERCRHRVSVHVADPDPPALMFYSASMIWVQAPSRVWDVFEPTLGRIAGSFRVRPGKS